ncbi:MAG: hypothetical protein IH921_12760, partial [Gemmatimonadetes bacterium]|nr:hypothetical protein [Gemmatimonadota bacterium]
MTPIEIIVAGVVLILFLAAALVVVMGALIVAVRAAWLPGPELSAVWPILGAMFMFRLPIYLYDLRHQAAPFSLWRAAAYFFMVPNVCFPLFPVVDYKTFCLTYYNDDAIRIYQVGLKWILRGVVQLVVYRLVYHAVLIHPADIVDAGDFFRFMLGTYLLYLWVSGTFHIIIGMLHLFGFNLPETHHLYLLSSSFTDFWRRINIYWKDFIMKLFFYPLYFRLRGLGTTKAMVISTIVAFMATWLLHSYQWYWIRGAFPITLLDLVFWGVLGGLVIVNLLFELRSGRQSSKKPTRGVRVEIGRALRTIGTFVVICVIWSIWTSESFAEWIALASKVANFSAEDVLFIGAVLAAVGVGAVLFGRSTREWTERSAQVGSARTEPTVFWRSAVTIGAVCAVMVAFSRPAVQERLGPRPEAIVKVLSRNKLNRRDSELLERGYYEDLTDVTRYNTQLMELFAKEPVSWRRQSKLPLVDENDPYSKELIPSQQVHHRGVTLTTNRWGMRDRDYELSKPPDTYRVALIGASISMGRGVEDDETYEALLEARLNQPGMEGPYRHYEILNFSVGGSGPLAKLTALEGRVLDFEPDAIIYEAHNELYYVIRDVAYAASRAEEIPHEYLQGIAERAGVEVGMATGVAAYRLLPYGPDLLEWFYARIAEQCRQRGIRPFVLFFAKPGVPIAKQSDALQQIDLARSAGFTVLDMTGAYDGVEDVESLWLLPSDWHPNAEAHQLLADELYELLQMHLGDSIWPREPPSKEP